MLLLLLLLLPQQLQQQPQQRKKVAVEKTAMAVMTTKTRTQVYRMTTTSTTTTTVTRTTLTTSMLERSSAIRAILQCWMLVAVMQHSIMRTHRWPCFLLTFIISISDDVEVSAVDNQVPEGENAEDPTYTLLLCKDPAVKNGVFFLSAPNSVWLKTYDWANGQMPCNMKVNNKGKYRGQTSFIRRIRNRQKEIKRRGTGKNHNNPEYLNRISTVWILRGELTNEEVL